MISTLRPFRLFVPTLGLLVAGAVFTSSSIPPLATRTGAHEQGQDETADTKLAGIMLKMRSDMKQLRRELEGKDAAAAWKTVCSIQQHILEAKLESPDTATAKPEPQRATFVSAFRAKVSEFLKRSCDLEAAVLGSKLDEAGEILGEMMGPMQKAGHKEFRSD